MIEQGQAIEHKKIVIYNKTSMTDCYALYVAECILTSENKKKKLEVGDSRFYNINLNVKAEIKENKSNKSIYLY